MTFNPKLRPLTPIAINLDEDEIAFLNNTFSPHWQLQLTTEDAEALLEPFREMRKFEEADRLLAEFEPTEEVSEEHARLHDESWLFDIEAGQELDEDGLVATYGEHWRDEVWRIDLARWVKPKCSEAA